MHEMLFGHSQVATTLNKEVNYFNFNYNNGERWYQSKFTKITSETRLLADFSPRYIEVPEVVDRIKQSIQDPIIMIHLRSPYERVRSWYAMFGRHEGGGQTRFDSDFVLDQMLRIGPVAGIVEKYLQCFEANRVMFFCFDELSRSSRGLAEKIQLQLGLDVELPASVKRRVHGRVAYTTSWSQKVISNVSPFAKRTMPSLFYALKFGPLHRLFWRREIPQPDDVTTMVVFERLAPAFEADIDRMQQLTGMDFSSWRLGAAPTSRVETLAVRQGAPQPSEAATWSLPS